MLSSIRHRLIFFLFLLLPFHALFVTVGTKMIVGVGHAPLWYLAIWKEVIIAVLFIIGMMELFPRVRKRLAVSCERGEILRSLDVVKGSIIALLCITFILLVAHRSSLTAFIYGFKYLFVPVIFFLLMQSLEWDDGFVEKKIIPLFLCLGGILAAYGIATFFLPMQYFVDLGYSDAHSLYTPTSSLSAFQQIGGTAIRRIQGTFAGPNQLALWLLLPWAAGMVLVCKHREQSWWLPIFLVQIALILTFSRAAWIAAFCITIIAVFLFLRKRSRNIALSGLVITVVLGVMVVMVAMPHVLLRSISNQQHVSRSKDAVIAILVQPLGHGLGTAGPASNRISDTCLFFEDGADLSWASERNDLCLFIADEQVRPSLLERTCHCPVLPENWYLQVGYELGILGFALFILLTVLVLRALFVHRAYHLFLIFFGISIAALFLHAWEDSAVAYTVWGLVGITFSRERVEEKNGS